MFSALMLGALAGLGLREAWVVYRSRRRARRLIGSLGNLRLEGPHRRRPLIAPSSTASATPRSAPSGTTRLIAELLIIMRTRRGP